MKVSLWKDKFNAIINIVRSNEFVLFTCDGHHDVLSSTCIITDNVTKNDINKFDAFLDACITMLGRIKDDK